MELCSPMVRQDAARLTRWLVSLTINCCRVSFLDVSDMFSRTSAILNKNNFCCGVPSFRSTMNKSTIYSAILVRGCS